MFNPLLFFLRHTDKEWTSLDGERKYWRLLTEAELQEKGVRFDEE